MTRHKTTLAPPNNPTERRAWVIYQLKLRGQSLASIAASLGVRRQAVCGALMVPSERIERALATALGIPVITLFPERFNRMGCRIPHTRPDNINVNRAGGNSQNDKDALTAPGRVA